jgi:uncharacterized cupredoxin-like copper-binding protein
MKRCLILAVFLLFWSTVLVACGSEAPSTSTQGGASQSASSQGATPQSAGGQDVHIVMTEMKIESDVTTFAHGVPYHFIIVNKGAIEHEFEIAKKVAADATEAQHDAASLKELQRLGPGGTQTLDYTFADAAPAGTLELECGIPGHYMAGMHIDIVVQ